MSGCLNPIFQIDFEVMKCLQLIWAFPKSMKYFRLVWLPFQGRNQQCCFSGVWCCPVLNLRLGSAFREASHHGASCQIVWQTQRWWLIRGETQPDRQHVWSDTLLPDGGELECPNQGWCRWAVKKASRCVADGVNSLIFCRFTPGKPVSLLLSSPISSASVKCSCTTRGHLKPSKKKIHCAHHSSVWPQNFIALIFLPVFSSGCNF